MDMDLTIRRLALENALKFKGTANPKAIIGGVMREHPQAKDDMAGLVRQIEAIVADINRLSLDEQKSQLTSLDPSFEARKQELKAQRKEKASTLPDLPNAVFGQVVTRIPPEPSKYAHLGHAMSFLINYLYAKEKYAGKVLLRFDDTNPEKESQEFVDAITEDLREYLGMAPDSTIFASDHMQTYLDYADRLVTNGAAYVCNCTDIARHRREMIDCPHREQSRDETARLWSEMCSGKHDDHILRLRIDMAHKNAVMRDPVIFRVVNTPHYRHGSKYHVWPMYDFETAIEEGLNRVTHVLRSNEFDQRIELHNYIASLFNFPEVTYKHYGRYNVTGATTQGREIRRLIESGEYIGWDDPRLVTLKALRRRGIVKEAYYELARSIGLSKTQTNLDFSVIAKVNRNLLDQSAKRLFAVRDPVVITVSNIPDDIATFALKHHPHAKQKERVLACTKEYYIEASDDARVPIGGHLRFIDTMTLRKIGEASYEFVSIDQDKSLGAKLIHYVPKDGNEIKASILLPDVTTQEVICEPSVAKLAVGDVIQFERYAFCRLDEIEGDVYRFWFTHE